MFHSFLQNTRKSAVVSSLTQSSLNTTLNTRCNSNLHNVAIRHYYCTFLYQCLSRYSFVFSTQTLYSHFYLTPPYRLALKQTDLPVQWQYRVNVWDTYVSKYLNILPDDSIKAAGSKVAYEKDPLVPSYPADMNVELVLGDEVLNVPGHKFVTSAMDLIPKKHEMKKTGLVCTVNGEVWDLTRPLEGDSRVIVHDFNSELGQQTFWHSSAHILGQAMEYFYRDHQVSLSDGPALKDGGYFYDAFIQDQNDQPVTVSSDHIKQINALCKSIGHHKQPFQRLVVPIRVAREMFHHNAFKQQTLDKIVQIANGGEMPSDSKSLADLEDATTVTLYRCGPLIDLCRGPHVPSTLNVSTSQVEKVSASVLRVPTEFNSVPTKRQLAGQEPHMASISSVQRVYGISYPNDALMAQHVERKKNAELADHRRLGKLHELFMFHPISPGSPFFLPKGTHIYNKLLEFLRGEYVKRGYKEVRTPQVFDKSLWMQSGHWDNYKDDMFYVSKGHVSVPADLSAAELQCTQTSNTHVSKCNSEGDMVEPDTQVAPDEHDLSTQALKPMNCPGHCVMFGSSLRSYRDLPLRLADFGTLHRNEVSGALTGLTRVRSFTQDDAHIFCTAEQMADELKGCLDFINSVYSVFQLPLFFKLSTRPDNYIGSLENWNLAEESLKNTLNENGLEWEENPGDGAFYGPKVDVTVRDALGRYHQCATIQLDFNLPERFELSYKGSDGLEHRPVMIHRAILGSIERFMAVLLEHTVGKLPLWLSPRQVYISFPNAEFVSYAEKIRDQYEAAGFVVDVGDTSLRLSKQVLYAQSSRYNYILTVGAKEMESNTVSIRPRDAARAEAEPLTVDDFLARIKKEVADKSI